MNPSAEPLPERIRLVVLFGGRSAEHDVSRVSASHVMSAIDPDRYEVVPVGITRDGDWQLAEQALALLADRRSLPPSIVRRKTPSDVAPVMGAGAALVMMVGVPFATRMMLDGLSTG